MSPGASLALLVLAAFVAGAARGRWRLPSGVLLASMALLWFRSNSPVEGEVLVVVSPGHGFTESDVAGVLALGLAAFRVLLPLGEVVFNRNGPTTDSTGAGTSRQH